MFYFQASAVLCLRCIRGNKKTSGNHHHCSSGTIFLGSPTDSLPSFHLSETFYGFLVYYVQDIFIVRENNCKKWDDSTLARNRSPFVWFLPSIFQTGKGLSELLILVTWSVHDLSSKNLLQVTPFKKLLTLSVYHHTHHTEKSLSIHEEYILSMGKNLF